jgi:hypothetical protein
MSNGIGYGWGDCKAHGWKGGQAGGGGPVYEYGWPAEEAEPNVVAQWLFDESSGNIVDEVSGITLTATGSPTYSVDGSSYSVNTTPGIKCIQTTVDGFTKAGNEPTLDIGTDDFVIEFLFAGISGQSAIGFLFDTRAGTGDNRGYAIYTQGHSTGNLTFLSRATDNTQIYQSINTGIDFRDEVIRKFRYVGDRSGNLELFIDGVSQGTSSLSSWSGKTVDTFNNAVGTRVDGGVAMLGTLYELRMTIGNATNNSGTTYYGWPSNSANPDSEPNVVAQWLFDESSGNIVDEVGGVSLAPNGTPDYSYDSSSYSSAMPTGINLPATTESFTTTVPQASMNLGTDDFVYEAVINTNGATSASYRDGLSCWDRGGATLKGYYFWLQVSSNNLLLNWRMTAEDATSANGTINTGIAVNDTNWHKVRVTGDRSGNLQIYVDGTLGGNASISSLNTKTVNNYGVGIGADNNGQADGVFGYTETRLTVGNITNNSGGPGD